MLSMINTITLLLCGFSIISALVLTTTHLDTNNKQYKGKLISRIAGIVLLLGLASMQFIHYDFLANGGSLVNSKFYIFLLFIVSPAFYFFIRDVLRVENSYQAIQLLHLLPSLIALLLPQNYAQLLAFVFGTGYVLWLAYRLYFLRSERSRFTLEMLSLLAVAIVAILVLILGVFMPLISDHVFYTSYALLLGIGFVVIIYTLLRFPDITQEVAEAAQAAYAVSTLNNLDSDALVLKLRQLLEVEKLFSDDKLSLRSLAEKMDISNHQLSELINTRFNKSFSQLLREYRITEAKRMLIDEPNASVLSIGLSTGFTSQSNFYTAFKELTGMAPGNYRKAKNKENK